MRAVASLVNVLAPSHEHEFEAAPGLPEALPASEVQLWQGSPDALLLARQALHLDLVLVYFGALLAWRGISSAYDGAPLGQTLAAMAGMLPLIALALTLLGGIAWLMARTTVYTITSKRVVMRVGVVLSITFNLPFAQIASAGWRQRGKPGGQGDQGGDIVLSLAGADRIAYLHLWPHARPWELRDPQPAMRCVPEVDVVGRKLLAAWQAVNAGLASQGSRSLPAAAHAAQSPAAVDPRPTSTAAA